MEDNLGPWSEYDLVDGNNENDMVGIVRKNDPFKQIITPKNIAELPNPYI